MSRRASPLTGESLSELPAPVSSTIFFEVAPVERLRVEAAGTAAVRRAKADWIDQVSADWGTCGWVLKAERRPLGVVWYAPPSFLPGAGSLPTAPVSEDAVQLAGIYVGDRDRGVGLGRVLVQLMLRDLVKRDQYQAVEAFGRSTPLTAQLSAPTVVARAVPPVGFLEEVGFAVHRLHPSYPRLRLDLRSALTWREEVEVALGRLIGAVRPRPVPIPASRRGQAEPVSVQQRQPAAPGPCA